MLDLPSVLQQIKAGKVRALAVTGSTRLPQLPDVPTLAEAGVTGYESTGWFGVVAPAATPRAVVARLQSEMRAVLSDPEVDRRRARRRRRAEPDDLGRVRPLHRQRDGQVGRRHQALGHQARLTSPAPRSRHRHERVDAEVAIVGAGPVGLTLALDLAARGRSVVMLETRARGEPPSVKCNHVAARTMEQFRRLGVGRRRARRRPAARTIRTTSCSAPRSPAPSCRASTSRRARRATRDTSGPDGWWPTPEPPHRINQIYLEPILFAHAEAAAPA